MTGRTHDVAAFAALTAALLYLPLVPMSLPTAAMAFGANFIGGLFPDIDQPTSDLWDNFRGGEFVSKVVCRFLGGHRHISHSLIGVGLIGFILDKTLYALSSIILLDMRIVWWSFMIGVVSHLLMDMPTKEGIPLFWPLKVKIGIPPFRFLRIRSGHFVENFIIFPGFCFLILYLLFTNQVKVLDFLHNYIR